MTICKISLIKKINKLVYTINKMVKKLMGKTSDEKKEIDE